MFQSRMLNIIIFNYQQFKINQYHHHCLLFHFYSNLIEPKLSHIQLSLIPNPYLSSPFVFPQKSILFCILSVVINSIRVLPMDLQEHLSEESNKKVDHLNHLLATRIGYGFAQQKMSRSLYLLLFSEGCETIVLGLLLPVLAEEWQLGKFEQSLLITIVYFGVAIGSYLQVYSDRFGRYAFITWDAGMQTLFGLFSCICWNFNSFLLARFFYGIGIGICLPLSASYITEISPASVRATLMSKSRVYWSGGCLATSFLGWYFLQSNSWRTLLFLICLPGIYAMYQHKVHGRQSLRYLWVQRRGEQVYETVSFMCKLNNMPQIPKSQILALMKEDEGVTEAASIPISEMFNQKYKESSIRLLSSWFSVCFIYYGVMILLPSILQRVFTRTHSNQNFKYLFIVLISIVEVAAFFFSSKIMDHPKIGRKRSVYYGFAAIFIVTVLILICGEENKFILFTAFVVIKFVASATFMTLYPYTAQIYQTMIRGKALGICSMSGRIATTFLGIVGVSALSWFGGYGLYLIIIVLCVFSGYGAYTMPYCTGNRAIS